MKRPRAAALTLRQFYALTWKDFVVHKRHYIWTLLEVTIPVLVCALAILSNSHQGKPRLENERTFEPDDYERIYGDLSPHRHRLLVAPNSSFTRALVGQIDDGAVSVQLCDSEQELVQLIRREIPVSLDQVKRLLPDDNANLTIGGVVIRSDAQLADANASRAYFQAVSKLDGQPMQIPVHLDMSITAKDFRLGPEPFPKKYSLGPFLHADHYQSTFFMASQIMLSRAYISLVANYLNESAPATRLAEVAVPSNDDIIGQRMPYPKYVAHKRLKETTLGTFVAGAQKQKPFVLTMDYCITVGFLVTAIFLAKRIVDEKKSRVRDMLRLVGISDWTYYASHMTNTMAIMLVQCALITLLFTGHQDAPAQNIDSTLMFAILIVYCLAAVMFVLALSTLFTSSTKAIIFTSLLWLGLPETLDRVFKMSSGVIESNGFLALDEHYHLLFCLLPNFGLRLMNRLLTECDIYGEFYAKKQLYGEYRAIWPNVANVLPLYKTITVAHIMGAMLASLPLYACLIYLVDVVAAASPAGLAGLGQGVSGPSGAATLARRPAALLLAALKAPFSLLNQMLAGSAYSASARRHHAHDHLDRARANLNQSAPSVFFAPASADKQGPDAAGHLNAAYADSLDTLAQGYPRPAKDKGLANQLELATMSADAKPADTLAQCKDNGALGPPELRAPNDAKYFEAAPGMLSKGVSIRNLCKSYLTSSSKLRRIDAVRNVSLDMYYSQILGKWWCPGPQHFRAGTQLASRQLCPLVSLRAS